MGDIMIIPLFCDKNGVLYFPPAFDSNIKKGGKT